LGTIEHYLRKAAAGLDKAFRREAGPGPRLPQLERELIALTMENQTLAGKLERSTADSGRHRSEALQRFETLEQALRETDTARVADAGKLFGLEQRLAAVQAERTLELDRIKALESLLADTKSRLETRDNQLKFLQDSAREQLQVLKTSLAEASSRLGTRDDELRRLQDTTHEQIAALERSLADASGRFDITEGELSGLRTRIDEHAQRLETVLASVNGLFEATNNQVQALEKKLDLEHKLQQNQFQDTQAQLHRQDRRLYRVVAATAVVLLMIIAIALVFRLIH
jgi:chromosome segregation ATPase